MRRDDTRTSRACFSVDVFCASIGKREEISFKGFEMAAVRHSERLLEFKGSGCRDIYKFVK